MKEVTNLKIFKNIKKYILLTATAATVISVSGCSKKDTTKDKLITDITNEVSNNTCFDEILNLASQNLEDINNLEEYLKLSEELHNLSFRRVEVSSLDGYQLLTPEEIQKLIVKYNDNSNNKEVSLTEIDLSNQEKLLNEYLCEKGYNLMETILKLAVKAKMLDANNMNEFNYDNIKIASSNVGNITNPEHTLFVVTYVNNTEIKSEYEDSVYKAIYNLYNMQNMSKESNAIILENKIKYNKDRNNYLWDAIYSAKELILSDVEIVEDNFFFINNGYKTKTKKK